MGLLAMSAPQKVLELVDLFHRNADAYHAPQYNEAMARQEFINPLFKCLGWDMDNEQGYAEAYKDVIHEAAIKIGGATKAPDYCFRIGGAAKFFLEAKRPSVRIKDDPDPAYQLRRYAWTGKLALSILTDFEEFAVYDCRIKPAHTDKASVARILYLRYEEYTDRWDDIAGKFSREAILKGSFDKFAESNKTKRGTAAVDTAFLQEIENWRVMLARNLALRNPQLSQRDLNYAVQVTIDRIIFLRMCEDRGIEPYGQLQKLMQEADIYANLLRHYHKADERYNSGLFHFHAEKGRPEVPDTLTLSLALDDKPLKDILHGLYYPLCPYEFSVLSGEILGQVYEQFLGKVIRLTAGHQAKVEDKPEVRKAGGVYYTPAYIVDYIVKQTVGKLLGEPAASAGFTPKQAAKLRILDPACGSGSFLLGAYQLLLDWHRDYYVQNGPKKHTRELYQGAGGVWRLTTAEKKRILLANIYGVDIDPQAVEVTKLSLLLKVLEGESEQTLQSQLRMFHERALPDLSRNIQCGNSLIGPDFYDGQQLDLFDEEERYRINVFDWQAAFPWLRETGGFDVVIGNPPYVRPHNIEPEIKTYLWPHYSTFVKKSDLYCSFIEKGVSLLKQGGLFGYIVSNGWLRLDSFQNLRTWLLNCTSVNRIVDFTYRVFEGVTVDTGILLLTQGTVPDHAIQVALCNSASDLDESTFKKIPQKHFHQTYKSIFDLSLDEYQEGVKQQMRAVGIPLGTALHISFGIKTGDDEMFLTYTPTSAQHKPLLRGEDVHRYRAEFKGEYVWYVPEKMIAHRKTARPGSVERFEQPKILIRDTGGDLEATFDGEDYYVKDVLIVSSKDRDSGILRFLTGILNSRLMKFYYETSFPTLHVQRDEVASLPIPQVDLDIVANRRQFERIVEVVDQILILHRKLAAARTPQDQTVLQRQIDATDRQIDQLVYELYGLTDAEIKIVEAANA